MARFFELLCIVFLGLGQMSIMTGYDTQSFVQESVLHSVHERDPTRIDAFAGYYGQAVCYAAYMLTCIFSPWLMTIFGPKWTLFLGSACFTAYQVGFFFLNSYYYYLSCAIMGAGFALYYTGNGGYLTSHSTRKTIQQNSAISWAIACVCMLVGSVILAFIFSLNEDQGRENSTEGGEHHYRRFTETEIRLMYGAFTAVTALANLIFCVIPTREVEDCIEGREQSKRTTFKEHMKLIFTTFTDKRMVLLAVNFMHLGLYTCFWVSVYPTTLVFTQSLSSHVYLPAMYSAAVGIGEILMGLFISHMSDRYNDFGLKPTMAMGYVLSTVALALIAASTPNWSTVRQNNDPALLIQPSVLSCTIIAFIIGLADCTINTVRAVICALAMPDKRAQAFSISKFYQALAGAVLMFSSPQLSIIHYCVLLFCSISISTVCFLYVAKMTRKMEKSTVKFSLDDEKS